MYAVMGLGQLPTEAGYYATLTREKAAEARAKMTLAERTQMLAAAVKALPSCYGVRTSNCIRGRWDDKAYSQERCTAIARGYVADWEQFERYLDERMSFCDERAPVVAGALGLAVGAALGVAIGMLIK